MRFLDLDFATISFKHCIDHHNMSDRYERGPCGSVRIDKHGLWRVRQVKDTGKLKWVLMRTRDDVGKLCGSGLAPVTKDGHFIEEDYIRKEPHWEIGETVDLTNYDKKRYDRRTGRYESLREKWKREERERELLERMLRKERQENETLFDGYSSDDSCGDSGASSKTQADWDNYSNQLNPNNSAYHSSRR